MDRGDDAVDRVVGQVRQRAVGAHAAGVRPAVAVAQALVVSGRPAGPARLAVAQGDDAHLEPEQALLDDDHRSLAAIGQRR